MAVSIAPFLDPPSARADDDQFVVLHDVDWKTYCALRELFDGPGVRMTYLKGALEIMRPSRRHEGYKNRIARLIELFALRGSEELPRPAAPDVGLAQPSA